MLEPIYFVVRRRAGVEHASIQRDQLKAAKDDFTRVWAIRMDTLEAEYRLVFNPDRSIAAMLMSFARLRDLGQLPPANLVPPPTKSDGRKAQYGERWTAPEVAWDRTAPADPDYSSFAAGPKESL